MAVTRDLSGSKKWLWTDSEQEAGCGALLGGIHENRGASKEPQYTQIARFFARLSHRFSFRWPYETRFRRTFYPPRSRLTRPRVKNTGFSENRGPGSKAAVSHQGQHDEFLFLFRDDDDDGVVESRR